MLILVTAKARRIKAEKSMGRVDMVFFEYAHIRNMARFVALAALQADMLTFQLITRERVVKIFLSLFPIQQLEIAPLMLDMAIVAVLELFTTVQSLLLRHPFSQNDMTGQALFLHHLPAGIVALGAILHAFQIGMRFVQFSWRQLGLQYCWCQHEQHTQHECRRPCAACSDHLVFRPLKNPGISSPEGNSNMHCHDSVHHNRKGFVKHVPVMKQLMHLVPGDHLTAKSGSTMN